MFPSPTPTHVAGARLECRGRVVEREGETVVRFARDCGGGGSCGGCSSLRRAPQIPVARLKTHEALEPGDTVTVAVPAAAFTRVAFMLFALPLGALVLGAWLGEGAGDMLGLGPDISAGLVGLTCLAVVAVAVAGQGSAMASLLELTVRRGDGNAGAARQLKCREGSVG